ncbi:hypothetical protein [Pandoraea oxalativorans]|uniref:Uncharacterized protein n=1 Tax=Pandoraea oxalativorans TaxID=573737 RepID=A0A0E3YF68_9BURK|nr:hypothetical protein [Pandoraea oxalativorans]AKC71736.1 hypothetical protein MB84_23240 [Pandoraea oxalativorans]
METLVRKSLKTLIFIIIFFYVASQISTPLPMPAEHSRILASIGDWLGVSDLDFLYVSLLFTADLVVTILAYQGVIRLLAWGARKVHLGGDEVG